MSTVASERADGKRTARRRLVLLVLFALLIGSLVSSLSYLWLWPVDGTTVAGTTVDGTTVVGQGTGGAVLADSAGSFTIEGDAAEPISPGVMAPLDLLLTNPQDVTMRVTDLRVTVLGVSAPNADDAHPCVVGDFTVGQTSSSISITVAARATSTLSSLGLPRASWPQVGMLERSANQDGCKGASLTLGYAASGTLVQR